MTRLRLILCASFLALSGAAHATCSNPLSVLNGSGSAVTLAEGVDSSNCVPSVGNTFAITNPTSTLTLPATTTAYAAGTTIASSATAGSVVVPSFAIPNTAGGFYLPALLLTSNDTTSASWAGAIVQIDLWRTAPTLTNGDRGAYLIATGAANYLGSYSCTFAASGDGAYAACAPVVGTTPAVRLASGTSVFWTAQAVNGSGATAASKAFTLTGELSN